MKIKDLPEIAQFLCDHYKASPATRAILTKLTGKICPEIKFKKDIEEFLDGCVLVVEKKTVAKPVPLRGARARNNDEPTVTVNIDVSRINYGTSSYTELAYRNDSEYEVPISVAAEGSEAIENWLEENEELWDNLDYDDFETDDTNYGGCQDEEIRINNLENAVNEANQLLEEQNENN